MKGGPSLKGPIILKRDPFNKPNTTRFFCFNL